MKRILSLLSLCTNVLDLYDESKRLATSARDAAHASRRARELYKELKENAKTAREEKERF